jgi:hypothetical protein
MDVGSVPGVNETSADNRQLEGEHSGKWKTDGRPLGRELLGKDSHFQLFAHNGTHGESEG